MEKFNVMDLFAGAGGLSNGFEQTGRFKVKVAVEINEYARQTYEINHDGVTLHKDITKLKYRNDYGEKNTEFRDIDIIIGGPPCQGFSNANRQQNTLISSNNQLVKEYIRAIEEIRPKAFVMENVKTLESDKHMFFLREDNESELEKLGIVAKEEKINIGSITIYTERLVNFLLEAYQNKRNLKPFIIKNELISKLNSLLRQVKKHRSEDLISFLEKESNRKFFINSPNIKWKWNDVHADYWDPEYQLEWLELGNILNHSITERQADLTELISLLERIIETQKIINKIYEVIINNVKIFGFEINDADLVIKIKTFNVFTYIKRKLLDLGYVINQDDYIFNAAQYGVPQERKRLILMGVLKEHLKGEAIQVPKPLFSHKNQFFKIYDAIGDLEGITPNTDVKDDELDRASYPPILDSTLNMYLNNNGDSKLFNHVMTASREEALKRFRALKEGQNFHDLEDSLKSTYTDYTRTQNTIYKRLAYSETSDTVVNVRKSMWIHPTKDRAISIREAARLQSFQDSYRFFGTKDSQYQQVGNAVPPLLARFIAEGLLKSLGEELDNNTGDFLISKENA
ncbi:DNA cytosine methyltransferase [Bacillus sp. FJAT-27251]|uniref:DNA cytosine methyltransferase n=1 Tax=Bacillus sp. FJAT-27251 TaxID=1684142 RepID=UPI0006A7CFD9|nr:DNA cytosine methyltransferase [Bacillus sp. FJAT-27251]